MSSFTSDVEIIKGYPAVQFEASEQTYSLWHEDREASFQNAIGINVSYMYRVVNAHFDGTNWNLKDTTAQAYAYAQLPDGSVSFLASPLSMGTPEASWGLTGWTGSGNFTRFNAADYGMDPLQSGAANASALTAALTDAATVGGRVFIPAGVYTCDAVTIPSSGPGGSVGLVIEGAGGSTVLHSPGGQNMFNAAGDNGYAGVRIRDIMFTYPSGATLGAWYAINSTVQAVICENCFFQNWPTAFLMEGTHNGMLNCAIFYNGPSADETYSPTMIDMEKSDNFVTNCYIYQHSINSGGPTGVIGIKMGTASEPRVTDTNIVDVDFGIVVTGGPNPLHGFFSAIAAECATTALTIGPNNNSDLCSQLFFNGCVFERTQYSTNGTPGIVISAFSAAKNAKVSDIFFTNCMSHDWAGSGMVIEGGQDITVTGGRFGSNGTASLLAHPAGITVTGPAVRLSVIGSDCSGLVPPYPAQPSSVVQPYGISVTGTVVGMVVRDCNLQGNATAPVYVSTNGTDLAITNCLGYNDQNTVITSSPFTSSDHAANHGYYGPSVVLFHAPTTTSISVTIYGTTAISMMFGTVPMPLATDTIAFGTAPLTLNWIGK